MAHSSSAIAGGAANGYYGSLAKEDREEEEAAGHEGMRSCCLGRRRVEWLLTPVSAGGSVDCGREEKQQ